MSALNWKDHGEGRGSHARASREVGGEYRIVCWPGGDKTWYGEIITTTYEIEYRRYAHRDWDEIDYPRGEPGTLAEAKRMAEEDHEQRRRAANASVA